MPVPIFDPEPHYTMSEYSALDILVTGRVARAMAAEGALAPSLFDQALLGPSLTCSLRGLRVDLGRVVDARAAIDKKAAEVRSAFTAAAGPAWSWGKTKSFKPSPQQLAALLYRQFGVRTRLGKTDNPSVAKDILVEIRDDSKTPEAALPVVETALELSGLEEDRKALEKPAGPDGRIHSSFMVSAAISGRWGSRKDAFGLGMNLHSASDLIRNVFLADPGYVMVSMDQMQAESNVVGFLIGSDWYIDAHKAGNVHVEAGKVFFPDLAGQFTKKWAKATDYASSPGKKYYDVSKSGQHAANYAQTPFGMARHLHIPKKEAEIIQANYHRQMPELKAYHGWIANEIKTKRRLISPFGRVRTFLGRVWEDSVVREAISWPPQSGVSDITKAFLYRLWRMEPDYGIQVLLEHHDSVLFQVPAGSLEALMPAVWAASQIPIQIGPRLLENRWEIKIGPSWGDMEEPPESWPGNAGRPW